ncbi:MAG: hypothetical protein JKY54_19790, partial [Flavobacteriales bacterium]|nr:hypothetical protein [Flavobacteriales bacterium]
MTDNLTTGTPPTDPGLPSEQDRPTPAVTVKPLPWRNSYGVIRADIPGGVWMIKGKIGEFSKSSFSMMLGDDPKAEIQAKHNEFVESLVELSAIQPTAPDAEAMRDLFMDALDGNCLSVFYQEKALTDLLALIDQPSPPPAAPTV